MVGKGKSESDRPAGGAPRRGEPEAGRSRAARRYTAKQNRALLEAQRASGQSMRGLCAQHELSTATLCKWKQAYQRDGLAGLEPRRSRGPGDKARGPDSLISDPPTVGRYGSPKRPRN